VDRTLRGAHAVQVLGRANRAAPHKPPVRVLDFVNSAAWVNIASGASSTFAYQE
jgi:type I site-specific restriction-modification system R (restriction) subunit